MHDVDVAVLGAGPVGLIAALQVVRCGRTAIIVTRRLPRADDPPRTDAVPAGLVALLLELGIDPRRIGVDRLYDVRVATWESAAPTASPAAKTAHVERPALELALLDRLTGAHRVPIVLAPFRPPADGRAAGDGWRARILIDATGRAAVTAPHRQRPAPPWVGRTYWTPRRTCTADPAFAIAALPEGYAYRLGAASIMSLGIVGRLAGAAETVERQVRAHAPWLLEGLPPLAGMRPGAAGPAGLQSTGIGPGLRIGDAALARDALSSQGLATGASEAMLAAAVRDDDDLELLRARQREQRQAHVAALLRTIDRCVWRASPSWSDYRAFVARQNDERPRSPTGALRGGRIEAAVAPGEQRRDGGPTADMQR